MTENFMAFKRVRHVLYFNTLTDSIPNRIEVLLLLQLEKFTALKKVNKRFIVLLQKRLNFITSNLSENHVFCTFRLVY